jgi:hypothetical protein
MEKMKMTSSQATETKELKGTSKSPLGSLSPDYRVRTSAGGHILDMPRVGLLELYAAGFTKNSNMTGPLRGVSRQVTYRTMYEIAMNIRKSQKEFPFGRGNDHGVMLVRDAENEYDSHAVHLKLWAQPGHPLHKMDGADLGYIPMRISEQICKHLNWFHGGKILSVSKGIHKKYYGARIQLHYSEQGRLHGTPLAKRFAKIMGD